MVTTEILNVTVGYYGYGTVTVIFDSYAVTVMTKISFECFYRNDGYDTVSVRYGQFPTNKKTALILIRN